MATEVVADEKDDCSPQQDSEMALKRCKSASITRLPASSLSPPPSPVSILRYGRHSNLSQACLRRSMNCLPESPATDAVAKCQSSGVLNGSLNGKRITPALQVTACKSSPLEEQRTSSALSLESFVGNTRHTITIQDTSHSPAPR